MLNQPSIITNIAEFRFFVTELNKFIREHGLPLSQLAKYDKQNWAFISGLLVGRDKADTGALTVFHIVDALAVHGIIVTPSAIKNAIRSMIRWRESIDPNVRKIGQGTLEVLYAMGHIREMDVIIEHEGVQWPTKAYYFGELHSEVVRLRRALAPIIQVKP